MNGMDVSGNDRDTAASDGLSVVCAFDSRYVPFAGVALFSLGVNMRPLRTVHLHLLTSQVSERQQAALTERLGDFDMSLSWHDVSAATLAGRHRLRAFAGRSPHYYRLLIAHLLPVSIRRAIYIDVDVIVLKSLQELWETPLDGNVIAACTDYLETFGIAVPNYREFEIPAEAKYFNTGVMLIDKKAWRAMGVSDRVLEYTDHYAAQLNAQGKFHQYDQYGINIVLHRSWRELDSRWNYGSEMPFTAAWLLHFNGHGKPWSPSCTRQFREIFYEYLQRSGWTLEFHEAFPFTSAR